jgi:hypothetical protein
MVVVVLVAVINMVRHKALLALQTSVVVAVEHGLLQVMLVDQG